MSVLKIVRQYIPGLPYDGQDTVDFELTRDPQLIRSLMVAKLHEEAQEVSEARGRDDRLEELADCLEVLHGLAVMDGFTLNQLLQAAGAKADAKGPLLVDRGGVAEAVLRRVR